MEKTAFITPDGLIEFPRMPQGVHKGKGCFQCLINRVLCHLKWSMRLVYLDDFGVWKSIGGIPREARPSSHGNLERQIDN
jgi:hypothetical protein